MSTENKNSYFYLKLNIPSEYRNSEAFEKKLDDAIDDILYSMNSPTNDKNNHRICSKDKNQIIHIFRTNNRKRKGQLNKFCKRFIDDSWNVEYESKGLKMDEIPEIINKVRRSKNYIFLEETIEKEKLYNGSDVTIFKDFKNWHNWQKEIFNMLFEEQGNFKKIKIPHHRKIISIVDFKGNCGKSSFWKYIYTRNKKDIGRLSYGTTSQLRSAAINLGIKKIYIIDLPRTTGRFDSQKDLINVIEDLKSGVLISGMYGRAKELIVEPPHIILSTNYVFTLGDLSKDRWEVYEIKNKTLGKKNNLLRKIALKDSAKK